MTQSLEKSNFELEKSLSRGKQLAEKVVELEDKLEDQTILLREKAF